MWQCTIAFPAIYVPLTILFLFFFGGAGHGNFWLALAPSMPLGAVGMAFDSPSVVLVLGAAQWLLIGAWADRWRRHRRSSS